MLTFANGILKIDGGKGVGNMKKVSDTPEIQSNPTGAAFGQTTVSISLERRWELKRERWCDFMCVFKLLLMSS
jgi:hypothetical protein